MVPLSITFLPFLLALEDPRFEDDWSLQCSSDAFYAEVNEELLVDAADVTSVRKAFRDLVTAPHNIIPYTSTAVDCWDALKYLDRTDPAATQLEYVMEIYSQRSVFANISGQTSGWNREHIVPKSYGVGYDGADTSDIHALKPADWGVNSARSNRFFDWCTDEDTCTIPAHDEAAATTARDSDRFQPPESVRGDVARSVFYIALRYNAEIVGDEQEEDTEPITLTDCPCTYTAAMGVLSTLMEWHNDDPPDDRERQRSEEVCTFYQGNRNPFVDIPELAEFLFDAAAAQAQAEAGCPVCSETTTVPQTTTGATTLTLPVTFQSNISTHSSFRGSPASSSASAMGIDESLLWPIVGGVLGFVVVAAAIVVVVFCLCRNKKKNNLRKKTGGKQIRPTRQHTGTSDTSITRTASVTRPPLKSVSTSTSTSTSNLVLTIDRLAEAEITTKNKQGTANKKKKKRVEL